MTDSLLTVIADDVGNLKNAFYIAGLALFFFMLTAVLYMGRKDK